MGKREVEFGEGILAETLNNTETYILVTMKEPLSLIAMDIQKQPVTSILNLDMSIENLERISTEKPLADMIVGFGGGTSCDTAKYLAAVWKMPLIIAPSIISVDAWLGRSVAVRREHKVHYVENVMPERLIVDYSVVKRSPAELNRAGICDVLSICTALGDWQIAKENFGDSLDESIFNEAKSIADTLIAEEANIAAMNEDGIRAIVRGQVAEVALREKWGNTRPEEGGEHFLAFLLEEITHAHYIHGNLICMNILIVLKLQREKAVYAYSDMAALFDRIGVQYRPETQKIDRNDLQKALENISGYVRRKSLFKGLWWLDSVFDESGDYSISGILDWIYSI